MQSWGGAGKKKKKEKGAHISTVNTAVSLSRSDTISLSSSSIYSESSTHPLSSSMKSIYIYIQCFRELIFLWLATIFLWIWTSKQRKRKWKTSLPSSEGGSFWNWFQFGCVFQDNENRVHRTRASFWGQSEHNHKKWGPHSIVWNVLRNSFRDTAATIPRYGMCEDTALETLQSHSVQVMRKAIIPSDSPVLLGQRRASSS